jgi:hypothetical protein
MISLVIDYQPHRARSSGETYFVVLLVMAPSYWEGAAARMVDAEEQDLVQQFIADAAVEGLT